MNSRLDHSGTLAPPSARPHYSCTRTGILRPKAARKSHSSTPLILFKSPIRTCSQQGTRILRWQLNLPANSTKGTGRFNLHNRSTSA